MVGIAGAVVFVGYWCFAYGWSQLHHCNAGFIDMVAFWRPMPQCNPDSGSTSTSPNSLTTPANQRPQTKAAQADLNTVNSKTASKAQKIAAAQRLYATGGGTMSNGSLTGGS